MPKAIAGKESVTKFTHKRCIAIKGVGSPIQINMNKAKTSAILLPNKKNTAFLIFE